MKECILRAQMNGTDDAYKFKDELKAQGFYAISGIDETVVEVYAIRPREYIEDNVSKITQKAIECHGGKLAYSQWGWIMRKIFMVVTVMVGLTGCHSLEKLTGTEKKSDDTPAGTFHVVSCCRDNNNGIMTYPAFLPAAHVAYCRNIRANALPGPDVYLAMGIDCGHGFGHEGDEYYEGKGY